MESHIIRKVEQIFGSSVDEIVKFENVPNNTVYKIVTGGKPYIFKIYKSRFWPEDGKIEFVNKKLIENHIPCAKVIMFDRTDPNFSNGFLIEEFLPGINAADLTFSSESGNKFYKKLASLVSKVHTIPVNNYGYIGSGIACSKSFESFMDDEFDERSTPLIQKGLVDNKYLYEAKTLFIKNLCAFDHLPSVLCHGDLSTKNVIIDQNGDFSLIDWDDAMSYNWMADISRLTYWMKFMYSSQEYVLYRSTFLENYSTKYSKGDFNDFEQAFHVYIGLDHLAYYTNTHQPKNYENSWKYFIECVKALS